MDRETSEKIELLHTALVPEYNEFQFWNSFVITAILGCEAQNPDWSIDQHLEACFKDSKEDIKAFLIQQNYLGADQTLNAKAREMDLTLALFDNYTK